MNKDTVNETMLAMGSRDVLTEIFRTGDRKMLIDMIQEEVAGYLARHAHERDATGQRCWVHKTANVLNKLPKSLQGKAKAMLHEIWLAATRTEAEKAFDLFVAAFGARNAHWATIMRG